MTTFLNNKKIQFINIIDMPFAAAITSTTRNARRCQSGHGGSEEETRYDGNGNVYYHHKTRPLNPNRNDYEDIENPFRMPNEVSKH